jgi:hypothetical protein
MITRVGRAAIFDRRAFTEAFFDDDAMADSAIIVALVGGVIYLGVLLRFGAFDRFNLALLLQALVISVASWLILGFATWFAASRLFGASNRPQTLIAMQGLASLPLLLEILGSPISWVGLLWYLAILVIATKEATDLDFKFASVSVLIAFAVTAVIRLLLGAPYALLSGVFS